MSSRSTTLVFAILLGLCVGCGGAKSPAGGRNLLSAAPDRVLAQRGVLVPSPARQWGDTQASGWETQVHESLGGRRLPHVWSRLSKAHLTLSAGPRRDRELKLRLWGPPAASADDPPPTVSVTLNDLEIERTALPSQPTWVTIPTPAAMWNEGRNVLAFDVDRLREVVPGSPVGLALAEVRYDEPRLVTVNTAAKEVTLQTGTGVDYRFEPALQSHLLLAGRAHGAGRLSVRMSAFDPEDSRRDDPLLEFDIDLDDQPVERGVTLPDAEGRVLQVELRWLARDEEEEAEFTLTELARIFSTPPAQPPIILIAIDTLTAKNLQLYGYERDTAPHLEEFARESVLFEHCETNAPWTLPSFMSLMTGLYPKAHKLDQPRTRSGEPELWERWYLAENRWTLAEMLRAFGYRTGGVVDNTWIVEKFGFPQGFDHYDYSAGNIIKTDPEGGIRRVRRLAARWIEEGDLDAPFFLFFHAFDVHGPYRPPEGYAGLFRDDALWDESKTAFAGGMVNCWEIVPEVIASGVTGDDGESVPIETTPIHAAYDEGIRFVDDELHAFFQRLKELGVYDRSIIIFTADHGEAMDEGSYFFGHGILEERVTHVPLLIRLPGGRNGGRRIGQTVQLVDLYPTILDYVGRGERRDYLHGRSLRPLLEGGDLPAAPAYTEAGIHEQSSIVVNGWKLVEIRPGSETGNAILLSYPDLPRLWRETVRPDIERGEFLPAASPEEYRRLAEEAEDSEILRVVIEGRQRTGMTPALFKTISDLPEYNEFIRYLRLSLSKPIRSLYYLPDDPFQRTDLASSRSDKVAELLPALHEAQALRNRSHALAELPTTPVSMSEEDIQHLRDIGYVDAESPQDD